MILFGLRSTILLLQTTVFIALTVAAVSTATHAQEAPAIHIATNSPATATPAMADMSFDVNVVLVPVTVTDQMNRPVLGLPKEAFTVYEDSRPEQIRYFFSEDAPVSIGLVLDFSESMKNKVDTLRESIRRFFDNANPEDDYYVVTVSTHPKLIAKGTRSVHNIEEKLSREFPAGATALLDGVDLALRAMQSSKYQRRVVVMITDGGDNNSHLSLKNVRSMVQEQNADVYGLGIFDKEELLFLKPLEDKLARRTLTRLTDATGGRTISVDNIAKVPKAIADLSLEIRNQYVLGYRPKELKRDSRWRKIKVVAKPIQGLAKLHTSYKKSYFAGSD